MNGNAVAIETPIIVEEATNSLYFCFDISFLFNAIFSALIIVLIVIQIIIIELRIPPYFSLQSSTPFINKLCS